MMLLRELNSQTETVGISGIQGALRDNPSFWSGGTYEEVFNLISFLSKLSLETATTEEEYNDLANVTIMHDGSAKIGNFIVEKNGRIVMLNPTTGAVRLSFSIGDIPSAKDLNTELSPSGSTAVAAGNTTSSVILSGGINATKSGSKIKKAPVVLSLEVRGRNNIDNHQPS